MSVEYFRGLARYNRWMNEKLYALAAERSDEERKRDRGAFFRSIHGTFNHLMLADRIWLGRFTGDTRYGDWVGPDGKRSLDQELYADFGELRRQRSLLDDGIDAWVSGLTDAALAGPLRYERKGQMLEHPLWMGVLHLFNHQTHHRGQITTLCSQLGRDPGVTDLIVLLRDSPG